FKLTGPAEWRGGIAQGPGNFILARSLPVECGVNRVFIRSTTTPGKITVTAKAKGLKSATADFTSKAIQPDALPSENLPSYLGRGPTPSTPSYRITRTPVAIKTATAGANPEKATASFDDNEMTAWANDNKLANGWIQYELTRPATLTQTTLKLTGWRQRSYSIRITVDDQEVYTGLTPKGLGYVTLPLKPVKGSSVRIALYDESANQDAFNIVELGNKKENSSTGADKVGNRTLSIVEAEFYEAAPE
ncbi:MAG: beta-galactosidase, partial [Verrucomicrobiaceae bacterium]